MKHWKDLKGYKEEASAADADVVAPDVDVDDAAWDKSQSLNAPLFIDVFFFLKKPMTSAAAVSDVLWRCAFWLANFGYKKYRGSIEQGFYAGKDEAIMMPKNIGRKIK